MVLQELHLGTANFAMPYGIANKTLMTPAEVRQILDWCSGRIDFLDYAPEYRGADELLMEFHGSFRITTKVDFSNFTNVIQLDNHLKSQLVNTGVKSFHHLLVRFSKDHPPIFQKFWEVLQGWKESGLCGSVGFSVYQPADVMHAISLYNNIEVFQVPENLLNRKFTEFIQYHHQHLDSIKFLVRSIFLQGIFFMKPDEIPSNLAPLLPSLNQLQEESRRQECSLQELAIAYSKQLPWSSGTVIGVNSLDQVKATYHAFQNSKEKSFEFLQNLETLPDELTDPRFW